MNTNNSSPVGDIETRAEKFKRVHGYSKTTAKLMRKYGVSSVEEYRAIRKSNKAKNKKVRVVREKPVVPQKGGKKK